LPTISFGTFGLYFSVHGKEAPSFEKFLFFSGEAPTEDLEDLLLVDKSPPLTSAATNSYSNDREKKVQECS